MIFGIVSIIVLVALDQLAKRAAVAMLMPEGIIPAIPGIFEWRYVENDGAAFSLLAGRQGFLILFTSIALVVLAFVLIFRRPKEEWETTGLVLIFAGGIGNLIDRIAQGYVVDYINLLFMNFAVFNLADIYVTVGFVFLVLGMIRGEIRLRKRKAREAKRAEETKQVAEQAAAEALKKMTASEAALSAAGEPPKASEPQGAKEATQDGAN